MSNYTIEISGNQPYYIEVDNSELQTPINLEIIKENDNTVEISSSNTFITFDMPSGYPIEATSGDLSYLRVDGLATYIQSFIPQQSSIAVDGGSP
jgi:hypothetical protein